MIYHGEWDWDVWALGLGFGFEEDGSFFIGVHFGPWYGIWSFSLGVFEDENMNEDSAHTHACKGGCWDSSKPTGRKYRGWCECTCGSVNEWIAPASKSEAQARKDQPITRGCIDYFPDALLAVAELSRIGNEQHNPGEEMHWAKGKSTDEADCIVRHLIDRGTLDTDGIRHSAKVAWRALALLQRELDKEAGRDLTRKR